MSEGNGRPNKEDVGRMKKLSFWTKCTGNVKSSKRKWRYRCWKENALNVKECITFIVLIVKNDYFISARDRLQREEVEKRRREVRQDRFTQFRIFKIKFAFRNGSASNENEDFMKKMNSLSEGKLNKSKKNVLNENDSRFSFKYFASSLIYEF